MIIATQAPAAVAAASHTVDESRAIYDRLLVVRCQLGERGALEELVRRWERPLLFYVRRLLPAEQDALAVMQEVWVKVLSGLASLRDPGRLAPWLYALARHTLMDHLRDRYTLEQLLSPPRADQQHDASDREPAVEDDMGWYVAAEEVHYGLSKVSVVDREVLTLYFLDDLSVDDIAAVLRIPPGTVKSRLFHARKALRDVLQRQDGPDRPNSKGAPR
jgi:RNA polymerase sigma factor (sigma-70 family)